MARIRRSRTGNTTTSEYRDGQHTKKFTQQWLVELDDGDPDPISGIEVQNLPGLPRPGWSIYSPRDGYVIPFAICRSSSPIPNPKNLRLWTVTCTFELKGASASEEPKPDDSDPNDLSPKVEPFVNSAEFPLLEDFDGTKILDPFGDLFQEPVKAPVPMKGVNVTRYVRDFDENTLAHWLQTTNSGTWRNEPEDAWCITSVSGQEIQFGRFTIGQLQFKIEHNPLELTVKLKSDSEPKKRRVGWLAVRAARSTTIINADGERIVNRLDKSGSPPKLTWVDKDGNKSDEPYYQAFRKRRQRNFSEIV